MAEPTAEVRRARRRHGGTEPDWLVPRQPEPIDVWLGHVAWRPAAGRHLRVDVTSCGFHRWDLNPDSGAAEGTDAPGARFTAAHRLRRAGNALDHHPTILEPLG